MLARWSTKIAAARTTVKVKTSHDRPVNTTSTGIRAATDSDATDEYLVIRATRIQMPTAIPAALGASPKRTPPPVATILPPR